MTIERLVRDSLDPPLTSGSRHAPADQISRQEWQEVVELLVVRIREEYVTPVFGLTEMEISIHYHRPLSDFQRLIAKKLGCRP